MEEVRNGGILNGLCIRIGVSRLQGVEEKVRFCGGIKKMNYLE